MEFFVHVGCHKTGTTYLQNLLAANAELMAERGLAYFPLYDFRKSILPSALTQKSPTSYLKEAAVNKYGPGIGQLLISDENIIGTCTSFLKTGIPYLQAEKNMKKILQEGDGAKIYMCIRRPSQFIVSAWAEGIRFMEYVSLEEFVERVNRRGFSWLDVVKRVKAGVGQNTLHIWTYENNESGVDNFLKESSKAMISRSDFTEMKSKGGRASMSQEGYKLLCLMDKLLGREVVKKYSQEIARNSRNGTALNKVAILQECVAKEWDNVYFSDIEEIRRTPGIVVRS